MSNESGPDLVVSRVEWVGHVKIGSESNTKMFSLATDVICKERNCPTKTVRRVHKGLISQTRGVVLSNLIRVACPNLTSVMALDLDLVSVVVK
jgi:hypothetical protein